MVRIIITRPQDQIEPFASKLRDAGFQVVVAPSLQVMPIPLKPEGKKILEAFASGKYGWVVFTSANGVTAFKKALLDAEISPVIPHKTKIAVQGPKTRACVLECFARECSLQPDKYIGEELATQFEREKIKGTRMLLAVAKDTRPVLIDSLRGFGAEVERLSLYETSPRALSESERSEVLSGRPERSVLTFFSPSAVRGVVASLGVGCELLARAQIVSIGPVTSAAIREMGLTVTSEASDHTEEGIFVELLRMTGR